MEPADFLNAKAAPKISVIFKDKSINPNGVYPGKNGTLLMVGFKDKDNPRAIYSMARGEEPVPLSDNIGMLDGLYQTQSGDILATDWMSGSLFRWNKKDGMQKLASGFKGPADFCVVPNKQGLLVAVPDLCQRRNTPDPARHVSSKKRSCLDDPPGIQIPADFFVSPQPNNGFRYDVANRKQRRRPHECRAKIGNLKLPERHLKNAGDQRH